MFYSIVNYNFLCKRLEPTLEYLKVIHFKILVLAHPSHLFRKGNNVTRHNVSGLTEWTDRQVLKISYSPDLLFPIVGACVTIMNANFTPPSITSHSTTLQVMEFQSNYQCFKNKYSVHLSNSLRVNSGFVTFSCSSFKRFDHRLTFLQLSFLLSTRLFAFPFSNSFIFAMYK